MTIQIAGVTYLTMADAIYPQDLPAGMDAYAGYDNGSWADFPAIAAAHPGAHLLDFSVFLANLGTAGDDETGDMTDAEMVTWLRERLAAGVWRPVGYKSESGIATLVAAWTAAGIPRASYRLLSAHYGAGQHICGPATCGCSVQCDGTQWIDHGGWDESILAADFFAATPPSPPPQPVVGPPVIYQEDNMQAIPCSTPPLDGGGNGYMDVPLPAGKSHTDVTGIVIDWAGPADQNPPTNYPDEMIASVDYGSPGGVARVIFRNGQPNHGYTFRVWVAS